jgi:hypothetical protein
MIVNLLRFYLIFTSIFGSFYREFGDAFITQKIIKPKCLLKSSFYDDNIDISPKLNGKILKRILRKGNPSLISPQRGDTVEINWKIFLADGNLVHDSSALNETFSFLLGNNPREVILGWEEAVPSMLQGEIASLIIHPEFAFAEKGVPSLVPPNSSIICELELLNVLPSPRRSYKSVGVNESIKDELMEQINSGESVISDEVIANKMINETKSTEEIKYFEPKKHKLDPNERIVGEGKDHSWEESSRTIDITVPINTGCKKSDLNVEIRSNYIKIAYKNGDVILEGLLHGKVVASECVWLLLDSDPLSKSRFRGSRLQISLEKSHGHQEIWSTVFNREFLIAKSGN